MTVYADVLFLVNWSLDLVALYITGRLMSLSMGALRVGTAAFFGALFAVAALVFDMKGGWYISASAAVSCFMCVLAYRNAGMFTCIAASVLLFSVGSALGGAMTAIYSLGNGYGNSFEESGGEAAGLIISVAVLAVAAVSSAARAAGRRIFVLKKKVTVTGLGKTRTITALSDSGSFLSDPLSGRPALIVRADSLNGIIPKEIISAAASVDVVSAAAELPAEFIGRVRILPISGISGEGFLIGYRPDLVTVGEGRRKRSFDCIIAISSSEKGFSGCDAVIPADALF